MGRILSILFNTDMVQAILDGRKTVTRRVMKPANPFRNREGYCQGNGLWIDGYGKDDEPNGHIKDYSVSSCWMRKEHYIEKYAPFRIDDILYVRETWSEWTGGFLYKAWTSPFVQPGKSAVMAWRPSIHMPKEAARIWLKVTDVRVERLEEIDGKGCIAEGVEPEALEEVGEEFAKGMFHDIWDSTIKKPDLAKYGWDANPWVWVIEFGRCEKPASE